jgi:uncharacterized protein (TIGR02646 family)
MIFIDTSNFTPPQKWIDKANKLTDDLKKISENIEIKDSIIRKIEKDFDKKTLKVLKKFLGQTLEKSKLEEKLLDESISQDKIDILLDSYVKNVRKEFIDENKNQIWGELKEDLEKLSYGKCWYSEAREIYSYYHVDHFRPKKNCIEIDGTNHEGYWWLTFDWTNYRICGSVGNTHKRDYFAVESHKVDSYKKANLVKDEEIYLLDPLKRKDVKLINFNNEGKAIPLTNDITKWSYKRAYYTIEKLELNFPKLEGERKRIWNEMTDLINEVNKATEIYEDEKSVSSRKDVEKLEDKVRELIAPCKELSATYRACLRASNEDWAKGLLEDYIDPQIYCKQYLEKDKTK